MARGIIYLLIALLSFSNASYSAPKAKKVKIVKKIKKPKRYIRCYVDENCPGEDPYCGEDNRCYINYG